MTDEKLPERDDTIFLSHDWPTTIPRFGNTHNLLRRKPFFRQEVETDTLGSPPLLQLLKKVKPEYWFSAHLHVKFAAIFKHESQGPAASAGDTQISGNPDEIAIESDEDDAPTASKGAGTAANPDEINIDSDDVVPQPAQADNPDEINIDSDEEAGDTLGAKQAAADLKVDESVDLVEEARKSDSIAAPGVIGSETPATPVQPVAPIAPNPPPRSSTLGRRTRFLALDKCGPGKDFIQVHTSYPP
jgi:lariat debranching enzyme